MPGIGDRITVIAGRLRGSGGVVEVLTSDTGGGYQGGAIGYREDGTGRLRWVAMRRLGDLRVETAS